MAIHDLKQPANQWLADVAENLGAMLERNEDPSMELVLFGCTFEIRINELPDGSFKRLAIKEPTETQQGGE